MNKKEKFKNDLKAIAGGNGTLQERYRAWEDYKVNGKCPLKRKPKNADDDFITELAIVEIKKRGIPRYWSKALVLMDSVINSIDTIDTRPWGHKWRNPQNRLAREYYRVYPELKQVENLIVSRAHAEKAGAAEVVTMIADRINEITGGDIAQEIDTPRMFYRVLGQLNRVLPQQEVSRVINVWLYGTEKPFSILREV